MARQEVTDGRPQAAFIISRMIKNTLISRDIREALDEYELPIFKNGTTLLIQPQRDRHQWMLMLIAKRLKK